MDVTIILGSKSDLPIAEKAEAYLKRLGIKYEMTIASAHRTPNRVKEIVAKSEAKIFIAIAGLSAALPGVVSSYTVRPVIGVPVGGSVNLDAMLSIMQMPPGVPVATVGLDRGENAALLAAEMLAISDSLMRETLESFRKRMIDRIIEDAKSVENR